MEDKGNESEKPIEKKEEAADGEIAAGTSTGKHKSDDTDAIEQIRKYMAEKLGFSDKADKKKVKVLESVSVDSVVKFMKSDDCKKIIVLAGAGISTAAGIPDFRSPGSGLYHNLSSYNLPHPQAIFDLDYFKQHPEPFFALSKQLIPGTYRPTRTHHFIKLLHDKGLLLRHYTQNIDGLEKAAGVPHDKVVEAHGTFYTSHCMECLLEYSFDWLKDCLAKSAVARCDACQGLVKPDVILFGESLPTRFFELVDSDFPEASLLIIMGSSLQVQPFASLVERVGNSVPRLLINKEKVGQTNRIMALLGMGSSLDLDSDKNVRDVAMIGDCDEMIEQFAEKLGWTEELEKLESSFGPSEITAAQFLKQS